MSVDAKSRWNNPAAVIVRAVLEPGDDPTVAIQAQGYLEFTIVVDADIWVGPVGSVPSESATPRVSLGGNERLVHDSDTVTG